jgi:tRNA/rRNA methyltransferase
MRSINLSHAVMIVCYEVFTAAMAPREVFTPSWPPLVRSRGVCQMKDVLMEVGFLNPQNPDYFMTHIRRLLSRTGLLARDVKILRGICRQFPGR